MSLPRRILVGTDFSDCSKEALEDGVFLAQQFGAELYLVHVFEMPVYILGMGGIPGPETPEMVAWIASSREREKKRLDLLSEKVRREGVQAHPILKEGTPFREILQAARENAADLIVLGTHGRTGLDRLMTGSVAERVVRHAPCPVFLVKPKALTDQGPGK